MDTKKWIALTAFTALSAWGFAQPSNGSQNGKATTPAPNQKMAQPKMDCSQLTADQQDFANQLSPTNKMIFCSKFNDSQRASAMSTAGQMGASGTLVTNDQAVEKVAKDNNIPVPTTTPRQSTGCPAKY